MSRRSLLLPLLIAACWPAVTTAQIVASRAEIAQLRTRLQRDSCDAQGFYDLGRALEVFQQYEAADTAYRTALAINPQLSGAWLGAGTIFDDYRRHWDRIRRISPDSASRERERREAMVRRAFLLDPFTGVDERPIFGAFESGETLGHLEWYKQELVREHGSIDSLPPLLLWLHAWFATREMKYQAAIEDVRALVRILADAERASRSINLPVRAKEFRYALAGLYHLSGNPRMAAQLYRDVIAEDLGNYMAHVQLARIADADHDTALGLRERQAAVDANPEDHSLVLDLGMALQRAGRLEDAEAAFRQARSLNGRDPWVHYRLGALLDDRGARADARTALTTFLAVAPPAWSAPIADARRRLEHLP